MAQYNTPHQQPPNYSPPYSPGAPTPTVIRLPRRRRPEANPLLIFSVLVFLGITGVTILVLAGVFAFYGYYQNSARIVPGVAVGAVEIGGMTREEAAIILQKTWDLETQLEVTNGMSSQTMKPSEIGLMADPDATAQKAHNIAHGQSMLAEMAQMFASMMDGRQVPPEVTFNEDIALVKLNELAQQMSQAPKDATLLVDGATLVPVPSELGYTINIQETLALMEADSQGILLSGRLQVIPQPIAARITDVTPALEEAQRFLDTPLSVQVYDVISNETTELQIPREAIAEWLTVELGDSGPRVALDEYKVAAYLTGLSEQLGGGRYLQGERFGAQFAQAVRDGTPFPPIIASHSPTTYTTQPGDTLLKISWNVGMPMWKIIQANPDLDIDNVWAGMDLVIPSKDEMLPLPVIPNKRIVISISKQRLWVYQDGQQISRHVISTGIDKSPTQPGVFQVQSHDKNAYASVWDLYMPNFLGIYESWPGFMNGIHGLPTLSNGQRLWANILGSPASYGCIILDLDTAEWLYEWAEDGVVVEIQP